MGRGIDCSIYKEGQKCEPGVVYLKLSEDNEGIRLDAITDSNGVDVVEFLFLFSPWKDKVLRLGGLPDTLGLKTNKRGEVKLQSWK